MKKELYSGPNEGLYEHSRFRDFMRRCTDIVDIIPDHAEIHSHPLMQGILEVYYIDAHAATLRYIWTEIDEQSDINVALYGRNEDITVVEHKILHTLRSLQEKIEQGEEAKNCRFSFS